MMTKTTVFDVLGKQIASLHEGYLSAGVMKLILTVLIIRAERIIIG
jgi:hypothetical protein